MINREIFQQLEKIVDKYVEYYKEDWTDYDVPILNSLDSNTEFLFMCRKAGTNMGILSGKDVSFDGLSFTEAVLKNDANKHFYHYDGLKLNTIDKERAEMLVKNVIKRLPNKYIEECKALQEHREARPSLSEWKQEQKEKAASLNEFR